MKVKLKLQDTEEASKGIFLKNGRMLLVKIANHPKYDIPGGKLKFGESREQGLFRECLEEVNLKVKKAEMIGRNAEREKNFFLVSEWTGEIKLQLEEVDKYRWVKVKNALDYTLTKTATEAIKLLQTILQP